MFAKKTLRLNGPQRRKKGQERMFFASEIDHFVETSLVLLLLLLLPDLDADADGSAVDGVGLEHGVHFVAAGVVGAEEALCQERGAARGAREGAGRDGVAAGGLFLLLLLELGILVELLGGSGDLGTLGAGDGHHETVVWWAG